MHKVIIIDDESGARNALSAIIKNYTKNFEIVAQADDVDTGISAILKHNPDIVLLDINLQTGTGFDLLNQLPEINFKIIFITAYDEFAIKAIKYSAFDYILKPIDADELILTFEKFKKSEKKSIQTEQLKNLWENISTENTKKKKIVLKTSDSIHIVNITDIIYCKSDSNYTEFHTSDKKIIVSNTLKYYEKVLEPHFFVRCHQSFLVNPEHIKTYEKKDGGYLVVSNDDQVYVSASKKHLVFDVLSKL